MPYTYTVFVDENSHYMDEEERYRIGDFDSREEALARCRLIVDRSLAECDASAGAEAMFKHYTSFGDDPFIQTDDPDCRFSAWDYAKERCRQLAAR